MSDQMMYLGTAWVFPSDIVAIEKGRWSDEGQDWAATVVFGGGARVDTELSMKTVKGLLEEYRLAQKR